MGFFSRLFGSAPSGDATNGSLTGPTRNLRSAPQPYPRVYAPQSQPGAGYTHALLQFQSYPENLVQGHGGVMVKRYFQSYEPQTANAQLTQVNSGTSGTIAGQTWSAPLTDTSGAG